MISKNRIVRKAFSAQGKREAMNYAGAIVARAIGARAMNGIWAPIARHAVESRNKQESEGEPVATNAPFFKKGQRVKAKSGRWKGEVGSIIDVGNKPGMRGLTRIWNPEYTVEFLHGTWKTDGTDLQSF